MTNLSKKLYLLSCGGVTLGILQGFEMVNFASLFTSFLATLLSALVSFLLGGSGGTFFE